MKRVKKYVLIVLILAAYSGGVLYYYNREKEYKVLEPIKVEILGRESYVYIPEHQEGKLLPLVVAFHGRGGSALEVVYKCGWDHIAYENEFIVVSPQYDGYTNPFAILVERENEKHTKDRYSSTLAWNFLSKFARRDGEIIEIE